MNVTIITLGSRGDVQPYVALARGLQDAGHTVRLASQAPFEHLVRSQGVEFASLGDRADAVERFDRFARLQYEAGRRAYKIIRHADEWIHELLDDQIAGGEDACKGADLIVEGTMAMMVPHLAEHLDVPFVRAYLRPETRTAAYRRPDLVYPTDSRLAARNRFSYSLPMIAVWRVVRDRVNEWRTQNGLQPWPRANPTRYHHYEHRFPVLLGYSERIAGREDDYPEWHHITGFWTLEPKDWTPPAELEEFLAEGSPPICLGFGSMPVLDPLRVWYTLIETLAKTGQRAIALTGWGGLDRRGPREGSELVAERRAHHDNLLTMEAAPHSWLYPQCSVVVHHGGAGTTAAALRAGVPIVVVPFLWDQLFWGRRAHALGVGSVPIAHAAFDTDRLSEAVKAMSADVVQTRAAELGAKLRDEPGVANAVALLEQTAERGREACLRPGR